MLFKNGEGAVALGFVIEAGEGIAVRKRAVVFRRGFESLRVDSGQFWYPTFDVDSYRQTGRSGRGFVFRFHLCIESADGDQTVAKILGEAGGAVL